MTTPTQPSAAGRLLALFEKYNPVKTFLLSFPLTLLLLYLIGWPGCLVAAAIGGFFTKGYLRAGLVGFLAGLVAWSIPVGILIGMGALSVLALFGALAGISGAGPILAAIILLIGGLLGLAGSLLGSAVYSLTEPYLIPTESQEPSPSAQEPG